MTINDIDPKKLDIAITYVQRMAEGYNPVTNLPAENESVINNPNVIRCMFFIENVLQIVKVGQSEEKKSHSRATKTPADISMLGKAYVYEQDKSVSNLISQINRPAKENNMKGIERRKVFNYLIANGFVKAEAREETGNKRYVPTEKGNDIGIRYEQKRYGEKDFYVCMLSREAQQFIVNNLDTIMNDSDKNAEL